MKILEKNIYSFKAKSDKLIGWNVFKCNLFDGPFNKYDLFFEISDRHKKAILNSTCDDMMIGEYGKLREYDSGEKFNDDELKLSMVFNQDGMFFEACYFINIATGEVMFEMDKPMIDVKNFVAPGNMDETLVDSIKAKIKADKWMALIEDKKFDEYCSCKFLSAFIEYVKYLEDLILEDKCNNCVYKCTYNLRRECKELYVKNEFEL